MQIIKISLISIASACLFNPVMAQAGNYDSAVKEANASIDKAKAVNYEWRDSRKLLKKAEALNKKGKNKKAMKLVAKAKKQGELAVAQAAQQSGVTGPHN
ncbi:MAG TPA: SoxXA-binding protein [Gammaproteobacteria bacterium]|nr:SoxXA-binding protein [Gammaproteobacteria bacterium]